MAAFNFTPVKQSTFILNGIPGLEAAHTWISIPFCVLYISGLLGNFTILLVVIKEQTLHKPMYILICMLGLTDIGVSTCVVPKALCIFWFHYKDITVEGCLTQIFFIYALATVHSSVLVTMAFDRYVAICDPLRYATVLTNSRISMLGLVGLIRAVVLVLPLPLLAWSLPFCDNHIIPNTYCEHIAVVKLSCVETTVNQMYGLVKNLGIVISDLILIGLSYGLILRAVLKISSKDTHQKALSTCTAHIWVILITYTPFLFSVLTQSFGQGIPAHIHILFVNLYLLVPPILNPIIYGVKTKELREKVGKYLRRILSPEATNFKPGTKQGRNIFSC